MNIDQIIKLLTLINGAIPAVSNLVLTIKKKDGTETTVSILSKAEAQFDENIKRAEEFLAKE